MPLRFPVRKKPQSYRFRLQSFKKAKGAYMGLHAAIGTDVPVPGTTFIALLNSIWPGLTGVTQ